MTISPLTIFRQIFFSPPSHTPHRRDVPVFEHNSLLDQQTTKRNFRVEGCTKKEQTRCVKRSTSSASRCSSAELLELHEVTVMLKLSVSDSDISSFKGASGTVAKLRKRFESAEYVDDHHAWCDENFDRNEAVDTNLDHTHFRPQTPPEAMLDHLLAHDSATAQSDAHFNDAYWDDSTPEQPLTRQRQNLFESIALASAAILPTSPHHLSYHPRALTPPLNEEDLSSSNAQVLTTTPPLDEIETEDDEEVSYYHTETVNSQTYDERLAMAQTPPIDDEVISAENPISDMESLGDSELAHSVKPVGTVSGRPPLAKPRVSHIPQSSNNNKESPKINGRVNIEWAPWAKKSKLPVFLNRKEFWNSLSDMNEVCCANEPKKDVPSLMSLPPVGVDNTKIDTDQKQSLLGLSMWCRDRLSSLISQAKTVSKDYKQNTDLFIGSDDVTPLSSGTDTDFVESQCSDTEDGLTDGLSDGDGKNDVKSKSVVLMKDWISEPRQEITDSGALPDPNALHPRDNLSNLRFPETTDFTDLSKMKPFANVESIALLIAARHALQLKAIIVDCDINRSKQAWESLKSRLACHDSSNTSVLLASHILSEVLDDELEGIWSRRTGVFGTPLPLVTAATASSSHSNSIHSISDPLSVHLKLRINRHINGTGNCVDFKHSAATPTFVDRPARRSESVEGNLRSLLTGSSASSPRPVLKKRRRPYPELFKSSNGVSCRNAFLETAAKIQEVKQMQREVVLTESAKLADDILLRLCGELAEELRVQPQRSDPRNEPVQIAPPLSLSNVPGEGHSRGPPRRLKPVFEKRNNKSPQFAQMRFMV